jgi:hypothetical protein
MSELTPELQRFRVRARDRDGAHIQIIEDVSFEAAAAAYAEDLEFAGDAPIQIIVRHVESGREHCFSLDPQAGGLPPCD